MERFDPFQVTVDALFTKLAPLTVKVKADPPAIAADGAIELIEGVKGATGGTVQLMVTSSIANP